MCGFLKPKIPTPPAPPPPVAPPPEQVAPEPRQPTAPASPEDPGLDAAALGHRANRRIGAGGLARRKRNPLA